MSRYDVLVWYIGVIKSDGLWYILSGICRACVQTPESVVTYGTETWAMKAENLLSFQRTEHMMVRWMCAVSLRDRKPILGSRLMW